MSSVLSGITGVATEAIAGGAGFALGVAAAPVLAPAATEIGQEAWSLAPVKALSVSEAVSIVTQDIQSEGWGQTEASYSGVSSDRFDLLHKAALRAPAVGELLDLVRRRSVSGDDFTYSLRKAQLDPRFDDAIRQLAQRPLGGAELANAIHRGNMNGGDLLPFVAPTTPGKIGQYPVSPIDPLVQAAWSGLTHDQLGVLVANAGLPLALGEMLSLLNRGEVTEDDVKRAVAHSNIRNEYMDAALLLRRRLLTPHEYEEAALRGVITQKQADAGAALSGMEPQDAQLLFEIMGRPLAVHQITTGLARGGTYGGTYADVAEPYRDAIRRSNIRPEYAVLAHANRYTYPSAFVLRSLVQGGELTEDEGHQALLDIGWPPDLAKKVAAAWGAGTPAAADKHIAKAEGQVWTKLHTSYVNRLSTAAEAQADLAKIGVAAAAIPNVLSLWDIESAIERRSLSPVQLKKAVKDSLMTAQQATQRLLDLGYSAADAGILLAE